VILKNKIEVHVTQRFYRKNSYKTLFKGKMIFKYMLNSFGSIKHPISGAYYKVNKDVPMS